MLTANSLIVANSLVNGFLGSNFMGQAIVAIQLAGSILMVATIIGRPGSSDS